MISKDAIESAYCFFHQKQRIYKYSTIDWQRDDIEYAVENYVGQMNKELLELLCGGKKDFLCNHLTFAEDIQGALEQLDKMLVSLNYKQSY